MPAAGALDRALTRHGIGTAADLVAHAEQVSHPGPFTGAGASRLRKIFLLSSVTIGRDIAVNLPAMLHLRQAFPNAEIILFADPVLGTLFGEELGVRVRPVVYPRRGNLVQLLLCYVALESAVNSEIQDLAADELLIVGMDSRLDQLMLLPLTPYDRQRYYGWQNTLPETALRAHPPSLAAQAAAWLQDTFPTAPYTLLPALRTSAANRRRAASVYRAHCLADQPVVSMNFGVGGNERKRIGDAFELAVIRGLVGAGAKVLLTVAPDSEALVAALTRRLEAQGIPVAGLDPAANRSAELTPPAVLIARGTLGEIAALIERSQVYVGYDSMAHHLAAALGHDVVAVFAGYDTPYFPDRWRPGGAGRVELIRAGGGPFRPDEQIALANRALGAVRALSPELPRSP
jgi:ADP-heptose:LPS heptosyltransferase